MFNYFCGFQLEHGGHQPKFIKYIMSDQAPRDPGALLSQLDQLRTEFAADVENARRYKELIASAEAAHAKATAKVGARGKALAALTAHTEAMRKKGLLSEEDLEAAKSRVDASKTALATLQSILPATGSLFVRLFLGQVNVREASSADRSLLREEYEKFRVRTNFGFVIFPLIWCVTYFYLRFRWRYTHWIHILTNVWLLYYYVSLALRENILKVVRSVRGLVAR